MSALQAFTTFYLKPFVFILGFQVLGWGLYWWYMETVQVKDDRETGRGPVERAEVRFKKAMLAFVLLIFAVMPLSALITSFPGPLSQALPGQTVLEKFGPVCIKAGLVAFILGLLFAAIVTPWGGHIRRKA